HARDPAVEHVEDDGPADERRRFAILAVEGLDDGPEAEEEVAGREQARQDGRSPAEAAGPDRLAHWRSPTTVTPATARSPFLTRSRISRGRKTSTRLPNLIIPTRSPAATGSPGFFVKMMPRAMRPAICLKSTRWPPSSILTP